MIYAKVITHTVRNICRYEYLTKLWDDIHIWERLNGCPFCPFSSGNLDLYVSCSCAVAWGVLFFFFPTFCLDSIEFDAGWTDYCSLAC